MTQIHYLADKSRTVYEMVQYQYIIRRTQWDHVEIIGFIKKIFKSNTNHFKCSFTFYICLFSNRKVAVKVENKVFTLGPVARSVTISPDAAAMIKSNILASHTFISIGCSC